MASDEGAGAGSILLAFILGAVSGAAVALLYAPASGRETREYLGDKAALLISESSARDAYAPSSATRCNTVIATARARMRGAGPGRAESSAL